MELPQKTQQMPARRAFVRSHAYTKIDKPPAEVYKRSSAENLYSLIQRLFNATLHGPPRDIRHTPQACDLITDYAEDLIQKNPIPARAFSAAAANVLSSSVVHLSSGPRLAVPVAPTRL